GWVEVELRTTPGRGFLSHVGRIVCYSPAMSGLGQKSNPCRHLGRAADPLETPRSERCAPASPHPLRAGTGRMHSSKTAPFNHVGGGSQAHHGSRVQYALRTARYACAASSNPFLDTAVSTTPTRNGLPSLSVSAVVATRSNGWPRRLGPLWVCSVVTGVVSCSAFT